MGATWPARPLAERELQVLRLAANGHPNTEIGARLYITEDTVKTHLRRINAALRARNRAHAVALALTIGLLTPDAVLIPDGSPVPERDQKLLAILLDCLGQEVCLRLVGGRLVPCEVAAIMPGDAVGVFVLPLREQHRYRLCEIDTIMRQEVINA
jgi:DNA-binding CsgD family transcriptional regulator